jgi:hypothetical protein
MTAANITRGTCVARISIDTYLWGRYLDKGYKQTGEVSTVTFTTIMEKINPPVLTCFPPVSFASMAQCHLESTTGLSQFNFRPVVMKGL